MPDKQDLALYKELKTIKSNFDKEMKTVKASIKVNNFSSAKSGLNNCDKYISNMENIIDKLPDKTTSDYVKKIVPMIISILSIPIELFCFMFPLKDLENKHEFINKKLKKDQSERTTIIQSKYMNTTIVDEYENLEKDKGIDLKKEINDLKEIYKKMDDREKRLDLNIDWLQRKNETLANKRNNLNKAQNIVINGTIAGGVIASISLKPLKSKAKNILKKYKKKLDSTRKYLDKVEKTSKAVKESLDETLESLYESFTEGTIDEFEYDTLIDHLLS